MSGLSYILDDAAESVPIGLKTRSLPGLSRPIDESRKSLLVVAPLTVIVDFT